jgi:molybdopterin-containing oxidoreductase family membrane subunit
MATINPSQQEDADAGPILAPGHDYSSLSDGVLDVVDQQPRPPKLWFGAMLVGGALLLVFLNATAILLLKGVGVWGINIPVAWGFAIINFVWWIGIGHAGTLISAVLLLLYQNWRTSINRFAEAMTLFAVSCASVYPLLHLGRPWLVYFFMPYPSTTGMWPQFRSPLMWDVFAINTYALVSLLFWYVGLLPDLAALRDRAWKRLAETDPEKRSPADKMRQVLYGIFALGWRGSARHWQRYEMAYLLMAGLATPLVVSVHTIVSFDFAVSVLPGWHTTVFPPYFVAGAIYCGFAMVLVLTIPVRVVYNLKDFITDRHLDLMAKVMLAAGLIVAYGYLCEVFFGWYSGNIYERFMVWNRLFGPYGWAFWALILFNVALPQALWLRKVRSSPVLLFAVSIFINIGMWLERYVIVIVSLSRDFLPSSWGTFEATIWDWALYLGTFGIFLFGMALFIRFLPMINVFEMKHLLHSTKHD